MDTGQIDSIGKLADMFKANGPFFFAILLAAGWFWTIKQAIEAFKDRNAKPMLRIALLGCGGAFILGSFVVGWRAVEWWIAAQNTPFGRYATVLRVPNDIAVWADAAQLYQQKLDSQHSPTHSLRLAFLLKSQCEENETLILQMNRDGMAKPDTFSLNCQTLDDHWQTKKTFDLDVDEKTGNLVLKAIKPAEAAPLKLGLVREAIAGGMLVIPSTTVRKYEVAKGIDEIREPAKTLQSPQATPGEKLEALGRLSASAATLKQKMLSEELNSALSEPLYATLLDLRRHSDRQLAVKARLLLAELPLLQDMARLAASKAPQARDQLLEIIDSMSKEDLATARVQAQREGHAALAALLNTERVMKKAAPPIPTYTRDGDRYYVKASWNNASEQTVQCIGRAYSEQMGGGLKQQTDLARSRNSRTVYYTKDWAEQMLRKLHSCGADASYVSGAIAKAE